MSRGTQFVEAIELLAKKELLLNDIVVWLKAKGLWKQFQQETGWNIEEAPAPEQPQES